MEENVGICVDYLTRMTKMGASAPPCNPPRNPPCVQPCVPPYVQPLGLQRSLLPCCSVQPLGVAGMLLEMELGITGGEEDGVNNEDVNPADLYTKPEEVYEVYKARPACCRPCCRP